MIDAGKAPALAAIFLALCPAAIAEDAITITPAGPQRVLYDWSKDRCTDMHIPDSPLRAFRDADGRLTVLATHRENWRMHGPSWAALRPDCRTVLSSKAQVDAALGNLWIAATYTLDGRTVTAIISEDQTEDEIAAGCKRTSTPGQCWVNSLLLARSNDGGRNFTLLPKDQRLLATIGGDYPKGAEGRFGVFTASNIVAHQGSFFMLAFAEGRGVQPRGNCLFRTDDLADGRRWRAFDGSGFSISMHDGGRPAPARRSPICRTRFGPSATWPKSACGSRSMPAGRHSPAQLRPCPGSISRSPPI